MNTPTDTVAFHIPTEPLTLIDCINRAYAATGSLGFAGLTHHADYNGHYNTVQWNEYRGYYVGEYFWAGREVFARSTDAEEVVREAIDEYDRQGRGAFLVISLRAEDAHVAAQFPRLLPGDGRKERDGEDETADGGRRKFIGEALRLEKLYGLPFVTALIQAADAEAYEKASEALFAERRARIEGTHRQAATA